jgi:hypothetical protein
VLALTTRPLTADERAELEARREQLVAKYSDDDEQQSRARDGAAWVMLWLVAVFGLIAVFNIHAGHLDTALVAGIVALFMGFVVVQRLDAAPLSVLDRPPIMRIEQALDADRVRVIDIHADAAVALRGIEDDDGPGIAGDLLRTGADQVIYVSRDLCADVDPERLPNTKLRIICSDNLELVRVEALGERCEPLAIVEDDSDPTDALWRSKLELIVWTPSEDRFVLLELGSGELTPYSVELGLDFRRLTTALMSRIYR